MFRFPLVFATGKVSGRKPDERSKCSIVGPAYGKRSTYQNVVSNQICPRAFPEERHVESTVLPAWHSQLESSWDKSPNSWSSDDSAARRREIILDQICRALPRGKVKSRGRTVTEISQEWFSRRRATGELCYSQRRVRPRWLNRPGGLSHIIPGAYRPRAREWIHRTSIYAMIVNINVCGNVHMHPHERIYDRPEFTHEVYRKRIEARLSKANQSPKSVAKSK